jgi:hypothetical protein
MARAERPTAGVDPAGERRIGDRLMVPLGRVVATPAKGLQVRRIKREVGTTAPRLDMVDRMARCAAKPATGKTPAMARA